MKVSDKHPKVNLKKTYNDHLMYTIDEKIDEVFVEKVDKVLHERIDVAIPSFSENIKNLQGDVESVKKSLEGAHSNLEVFKHDVDDALIKSDLEYKQDIEKLKRVELMSITNHLLKVEGSQQVWNWGLLALMVGYALVWLANKFNIFG